MEPARRNALSFPHDRRLGLWHRLDVSCTSAWRVKSIHIFDTFGGLHRLRRQTVDATMLSRALRRCGVRVIAGAALAMGISAALAQPWPPGPGAQPPGPGAQPPGQNYQNQVCTRLEGQLAAIERGAGGDPARAEQVRRYEDAARRQQAELDTMVAQGRRQGCEGTGFFLFSGFQSQQCVDLNRQISRMRGNLDRINMDLQRLQGGDIDRGEQRRAVMVALAQNNCGPQYRTAARAPGFFDQLLGRDANEPSSDLVNPDAQSGSFRTICVRTCDGFYFPISYATNPARFREDEKICQRMCPAAEVMLFSYRTQGEEVAQATSINGSPYSSLPNAFKYRQEFNAACSCKRAGQSWADALGKDEAVEAGDIVVTEDRAKQLSQPPAQKGQKGRAPAATPAPAAPAAAEPAPAPAETEPGKRTIRSVGPPFIPAR
jgi:Protein of unknown function (DUF2865)